MEDKEENKDYEQFIMSNEYKKAQEELTNQLTNAVFEQHSLFNIVSTYSLKQNDENLHNTL